MDDSSIFWNKIAEGLKSLGLPYISEFEAMLILLAAFLILFFVLWLVFRRTRLWYWKTNIQIDTLKSIDFRLHNIEEKLSLNSIRVVEKAESEIPAQDGTAPSSPGTVQEKPVPEREVLTAIGKSGRIYTEAEIELQIRD